MEPHIYVVNLKHRTDRKQQFKRAWSEAGLPTTRVHWHNATLGVKLPSTTLKRFKIVAKSLKARAGRVGCHCSHTEAIQKAIKENHFPLVILEDDVKPVNTPNLKKLFESAPPQASLLYFGALPVKDRKRIKNYCNSGRAGWKEPGSEKLYGGHAYGFRKKEDAEELVEFLQNNKITFDSALVRWVKVNPKRTAVFCPFQFYQSEGFSDIEGVKRPER